MSVRTLLVEDEPLSRLYLSHLLSASFPQLEVIGHAATEADALAQIEQLQPDLIFLDIELQSGTGFGVIEKMATANTGVIFTTAMDQMARALLCMSGVGYLQKPIDGEALSEALQKFQSEIAAAQKAVALEHLRQSLANNYQALTVYLPGPNGAIHAPLQSIIRFESAGTDTTETILTNDESHTTTLDLRTLEDLLGPSGFYRVHPHHLIHTACIAGKPDVQQGVVKMQDGSWVPVSARKMEGLLRIEGLREVD